jgi:hypothetical protein
VVGTARVEPTLAGRDRRVPTLPGVLIDLSSAPPNYHLGYYFIGAISFGLSIFVLLISFPTGTMEILPFE